MKRQEGPLSLQPRTRRWVSGGAVLMAALAAVALSVTFWLARRAVSSAAELLQRGEAEALVASVAADLRQELPTSDRLASVLESHRDAGLRYVAIVDGGEIQLSAGEARLETAAARPGDFRKGKGVVRLVGVVPRPHELGGPPLGRPPPPPGPFEHELLGPEPFGAEGPGPGPPPLLVLELEPQVTRQLWKDLDRTTVVAAVAALVLIAFSLAWSRSLTRLDAIERQAERERRLIALGRMSSVMAHELKNPLASLKGHAQLLAEQLEDDPRASAKADRIVREAERLELLTKSLLEFVRDGAVERMPTSPRQLCEEALRDLPQAQLEVDTSSAPATLLVDRARLARALHNLADNAIQAAPAGTQVLLSVTGEGKGAIIEVRDHGPGLSRDQIFEPFVTTRVRGTGLGLPIARRIVEQHGGTLTGETHPDGGALFRIRLPGAARSS